MPTITSLQKIKRLKGWFELTLDNKISFPINDELILKHAIKIGKQCLPGEIRLFREQGEYLFLKKKALDALSRRRLSEKELRDKLKSFPKSSVYSDKLIEELKSLGFINDLEYAGALINTYSVTGKRSKRYIRNKLYQKGLLKEIIEQAVENELAEYDESAIALSLAEKKYKSVNKLQTLKAKKRIADFLKGRGFNWDDIQNALDNIFREAE